LVEIQAGDAAFPNFAIYKFQISNRRLLRFLVRGVLAALATELLHLQAVRSCLPVLRRGVVLVFAIRALHLNDFPWHKTSN
jgi:hypothetical protein